MESLKLCKDCVCRPVCAVCRATGGMKKCRFYHAPDVSAVKLDAKEPAYVMLTKMCSRCMCHMLPQDHVCPGCGAIMHEAEQWGGLNGK